MPCTVAFGRPNSAAISRSDNDRGLRSSRSSAAAARWIDWIGPGTLPPPWSPTGPTTGPVSLVNVLRLLDFTAAYTPRDREWPTFVRHCRTTIIDLGHSLALLFPPSGWYRQHHQDIEPVTKE
ncbi:Uncharacterised protein [Mycobacteroides abscessus subsp. abscessus]|nr:Uncharacterised protein [Mycobacteroides abscessus subsp. abscessus]